MSAHFKVGIVMGSDSDYEIMVEAAKALREFNVEFEMTVASAHRSPARAGEWARTARDRGLSCLIAGAGAAAHLAGVLAAETTLPVIAVPIDATSLNGLDALLAMVQMPAGVPVATMAVGKAGARNAGLFAVQMLGAGDAELATRLSEFRKKMANGVEEKAARLEARLKQDGLA